MRSGFWSTVVDPEARRHGMGWMQGGGDEGSRKVATDHLTIKQEGVGDQQLISQGRR